ncbi:MAG TPA: hypothetical protein VG738_04380 [Chitinophagaceae bacterium]|nr:hypothetical protein [Chitinophagaceae bacterium]
MAGNISGVALTDIVFVTIPGFMMLKGYSSIKMWQNFKAGSTYLNRHLILFTALFVINIVYTTLLATITWEIFSNWNTRGRTVFNNLVPEISIVLMLLASCYLILMDMPLKSFIVYHKNININSIASSENDTE